MFDILFSLILEKWVIPEVFSTVRFFIIKEIDSIHLNLVNTNTCHSILCLYKCLLFVF